MKLARVVFGLFLVIVFLVKLVLVLLDQYFPSKSEVVLLYAIGSLYFIAPVPGDIDSKENRRGG